MEERVSLSKNPVLERERERERERVAELFTWFKWRETKMGMRWKILTDGQIYIGVPPVADAVHIR